MHMFKQFTVWPSNLSHEFSDWNECRVSLEQDKFAFSWLKTVALHLSCIDTIIQVACNNLILYILYSMCSSLPALRDWIGFFVFFWHYCWSIGLLLYNIALLSLYIYIFVWSVAYKVKQRTRVQMNFNIHVHPFHWDCLTAQ